jgi:arsenical pump membrane protein
MVLNTSVAEALSVVLLVLVLAGALVRPWGWPEAVVAVPAAVVVVGTGAILNVTARIDSAAGGTRAAPKP